MVSYLKAEKNNTDFSSLTTTSISPAITFFKSFCMSGNPATKTTRNSKVNKEDLQLNVPF